MLFSILVVADQDDGIVAAFTAAGMLASRADSLAASRATMVADAAIFDLIVVDAVLPDGDGMDYCAGLRLQGFQGPIVMLGTAKGHVPFVDDILPKPVSLSALVACVAAHVSRIKPLL